MLVRLLDRHVTGDDPIIETFETRGKLANTRFDCIGRLIPRT
jgi:hypothetical protein